MFMTWTLWENFAPFIFNRVLQCCSSRIEEKRENDDKINHNSRAHAERVIAACNSIWLWVNFLLPSWVDHHPLLLLLFAHLRHLINPPRANSIIIKCYQSIWIVHEFLLHIERGRCFTPLRIIPQGKSMNFWRKRFNAGFFFASENSFIKTIKFSWKLAFLKHFLPSKARHAAAAKKNLSLPPPHSIELFHSFLRRSDFHFNVPSKKNIFLSPFFMVCTKFQQKCVCGHKEIYERKERKVMCW